MHSIALITGGARSGKSSLALEKAMTYERRAFIATAVAFDDEMRRRIATHRQERSDAFLTVEEPVRLAQAIAALPPDIEVAVVDCLTVWLGNLFHEHGADGAPFAEADAFLKLLDAPPCPLILVANEVGLGIVPDTPLARAYRDAAGRLNCRVAEKADTVVLTVCGIPVLIKGGKYKQ